MTTQLDASIGMSPAESAYATVTTPTKFFEFTDESLDREMTPIQGKGLRVGSRFPRSARRTIGRDMASGDFTVEAASKGLGALFKAALGVVTTTQRASTGVYQQNHTPSLTDFLESYTLQKGIPLLGGGAAQADTFPGAVCTSLEIDCPNADFVSVKPTWNMKEVRTDTSYAAPSYPTPVELLRFAGGTIVIGGTVTDATGTALASSSASAAADIRDFTLMIDNALDDGGFTFGGAGKRSRKPAVGVGAITGTLTAEYDSNTLRDAYLNQTDLELILTFLGVGVIGSGSDVPALQIHIPNLRLESEVPKVGTAGDVVTQSVNWTGFDNLSDPPIIISYVSTDTAP